SFHILYHFASNMQAFCDLPKLVQSESRRNKYKIPIFPNIKRHFTSFFLKLCKVLLLFYYFYYLFLANNIKMTKSILPLYYDPVPSPCSRTAWFFTGFFLEY